MAIKCFICGVPARDRTKLWKHMKGSHGQGGGIPCNWEVLNGLGYECVAPCPVCGVQIDSVQGTYRWAFQFMMHCQKLPKPKKEEHVAVLALLGWI